MSSSFYRYFWIISREVADDCVMGITSDFLNNTKEMNCMFLGDG